MSKEKKLLVCLSLMIVMSLFFSSGFACGSGKSPLEKATEALEQKLADMPGFAGIAHSEEQQVIIVFVENEEAKEKVPDRFGGFAVRKELTGRFEAIETQ